MGRPRGSRNRNTLARELMAAVNDQDAAYVVHENAKVLDVANGCNDSSESESELDESQDSDFDPAIELCSQTSSQASALVWTQKPKRQHSHYQRHPVRRPQ